MPTDVRVCAPEELAPGQCRLLDGAGSRIAVFNVDGVLHAIDDACPHRQGPLSEGYLDGFFITCPWHGWQFDVRSGACETVSHRKVRSYRVRAEPGGVYVSLPDVL